MSKKNESLEALRDAILIRKKITLVLKNLALKSQKQLENLTNSNSQENIDAIREERFNFWLVQEECKIIATKSADLSGNLRTANTIFPVYMSEYLERRNFMNLALSACNVLQDELQYIAESVYADKNKFTSLILEIETLFRKIKSLRQSDNRFLKQIKNEN